LFLSKIRVFFLKEKGRSFTNHQAFLYRIIQLCICLTEFDGFLITESAGTDYLILNPGETALVKIIRLNDTFSSKVWMRTQPIGVYANGTDFENKKLLPEHIYESRKSEQIIQNNFLIKKLEIPEQK
jgi:hypothetical protein